MQGFDRGAMPAITMLADNFVLCDAWFCEVPGPTHPNRLYMHAGTSEGFAHNVFNRPFDILTIYELLERNHRSWAVYDFDLNEVRHFTRIASRRGNFRSYSPNFAQDVQAGNLPSYSFILPRFSSTHHAEATAQHAPHDVRPGDRLIADVYNHLRANDAIWSHCALIVTYDEHGGFFDHVAPPIAVNPDGVNSPRPDDNFGQQPPPSFTFDRLGPRVPALIVSPWVGRGGVVHTQLQHTSVLRAVRDRFGISQPLSHREEAAPPLAPIFDQAAMRHDAPPHLPHATALPLPPPDHHANPGNHWPDPTLQEMLAGAIRATRASHPQDDTAPPAIPRSEADVSVLAHRRWTQHNRWLAT
jgi:phospholipase C